MIKALLQQIPRNRKIICLTGGAGEGKTLTMSVLGKKIRDQFNAELYSNYSLSESKQVSKLSLNEKIKIVCIDEFERVYMNSKGTVHFLLNNEDNNIIFILTAFDINRLDEKIKEMVDLCMIVKKNDQETITVKSTNTNFTMELNVSDNKDQYNAFELPNIQF
ncbi:AAA family ATPase [Robertmurraya massiliosenegalensis]|uniref:AAA family ATPase n=1 Tax=Robertmurraya TaxID=2837507 RepID=UPI0039A47C67